MVFEFNTNNTYDFLINEYKNKDGKIYLNNYRDFLDNEIRKHYNSENIDNDKVSQKINNYIPESLINLQQLRQDIFTPSSKKITLVGNIKNSIKYFDGRECNLGDYDSILNSELFNIEGNIISNKTSEFNIGGINVNGNINIHNANDILFNDCKIKYNTRINPYKKGDKEINIILNNTFSKNIIIEGLKGDKEKTNSLILLYNKDLPELELINEFKLSGINNINSLNFFFYKNRKYIKKFIISELITENSSDSKYNITGLYVDELKLGNIHNNSDNFVFTNCKINKLVIKNSNLGKAVFNGVEIGKLEIENATLNDCIFNGVDFKTYELEEIYNKPSEIKKVKEYKNKIDIEIVRYIDSKCMKDNYRQLKHVMDKNANYTEANEFYALEMQYLREYYYKLELNNISKDEYINRESSIKSNRIILDYLYGINNYGTNVLRNLFVIYLYFFLITSISLGCNLFLNSILSDEFMHLITFLFIIFLVLISQYKLRYNIHNLDKKVVPMKIFYIITGLIFIYFLNSDIGRFYGIDTFTYLINPFSGLTPNSMSHLLWSEKLGMIIHKVIYGILIYQLIIALKRTTRR